jgi:hypothetical protein
MPGSVGRRQLLKISARIGVGPSVRFVRKQPGLRSLLSRRSTADRLYDAVAPMLDDPRLDVAGLHYFTFNELVKTWEWHQKKLGAGAAPSTASPARGEYVQPGEMTSSGAGKESGCDTEQPSGAAGGVGRHRRAAA